MTWLRSHWQLVAVAAAALGLGALLGWAYGAFRRPPSATLTASCDAGVAVTASVAERVEVKPSHCECDAGVRVVVRPPIVVYLPGDAGPCSETVVEVDATSAASATTGAVDVSVAVDAGATASAIGTASVVVPGGSQGRSWDLYAGVGDSAAGQLSIPFGAGWHPGGGDLGVTVLVAPVPSSPKQSAGFLLLDLRR